MILRILTPYLTPVLLAAAAVLGISTLWQTHRLHSTQAALQTLKQSITTAEQQSQLRAATTATEAVSTYVQANEADAPIVERVVTRTRNVCVREPARDLPVPAVPAGNRQAAAAAQDRADDAAWLSAVADDIETCAGALNMCRAQYDFHKANEGGER